MGIDSSGSKGTIYSWSVFDFTLYSRLSMVQDHINCLEHKHVKYMLLSNDKRVLTNNQYVSYALLLPVGSMHLTFSCSKQSNYGPRKYGSGPKVKAKTF